MIVINPVTGIRNELQPSSNIISDLGNTLFVGGYGPDNYTKIQDAIDNASDGDTVFVYNGTYYENLEISKTLHLVGEVKNTTIIDGNKVDDVVLITASYVTISKFTIRFSGGFVSPSWDAGIDVRANDVTIFDNILDSNRYGINIKEANNATIINNIIVNSSWPDHYEGCGIKFSNAFDNFIFNNTICDGNGPGISLYRSDKNNFSSNSILNNNYGIICHEASNNIFNGNYFKNINHDVISSYDCNNITIINNTIEDNNNIGCNIRQSNNITIEKNIIRRFQWGEAIDIDLSSNVRILNNSISDTDGGIRITSSPFTLISKNYILNNSDDDGIGIFNSDSCNIIKNILINNRFGIGIRSSDSCYFDNNVIENNIDGINLYHGNYNIIVNNSFSDNYECGIFLATSSTTEDNYVYHNNFINNSPNADSQANNYWDDGYPNGGNYWDDYEGADDNGDGIGDIPYLISDGANEDRFPFMNPNGWEENIPPIEIYVSGPLYGRPGIEYTYQVKIFDPDNDSVYCKVDWGDESFSEWLGPFDSGEPIYASHVWSLGSYCIRVKAKDIHNATSNWTDPLVLIIEDDPPNVVITKPENALYMKNTKIRRFLFRNPLILGDIDIEVDAFDELSDIQRVEFYIDGELKAEDSSFPYSFTWSREGRSLLKHKYDVKVVAVDNAGNSNLVTIDVRKFF